jgi:hypothetical protein
MLPGPDQIIACPKCSRPLRRHTLSSGNTFGAVLWSDGKQVAPMLPEMPVVSKCGHCSGIFWVEDAETLGEHGGYAPFRDKAPEPAPADWEGCPEVEHLDTPGLVEAIDIVESVERLRYLRVRLWHTLNNPCRKEKSPGKIDMPELFARNLEALAGMLDEADDQERLMKAECLRELGRHADAIWLLADVADNMKWVAAQIESLARVGNSKVSRLTYPAN